MVQMLEKGASNPTFLQSNKGVHCILLCPLRPSDFQISAPQIHRAPVPWEAGLHTIGSEGRSSWKSMEEKVVARTTARAKVKARQGARRQQEDKQKRRLQGTVASATGRRHSTRRSQAINWKEMAERAEEVMERIYDHQPSPDEILALQDELGNIATLQDAGISERRKEMDARHAKISWYEQLFQDRMPWDANMTGA
eukprot:s265_g26.t1